MGNFIKSCENNRENIQRKHAKTLSSNSALGKISTRHLSEKIVYNKLKNKLNFLINEKQERKEFNSIYKEMFPPVGRERPRHTSCQRNFSSEEYKSSKDYNRKIVLMQSSKLYISQNETGVSYASICTTKKKLNNYNVIDTEDSVEMKLNSKSGDNLRNSYIAKLISKKIWHPTIKEKNHNSIFIFDWDDTLLCTSFLTPNGIYEENSPISDKDHRKIRKLELSVVKILKLAISSGQTFIITNAASGWVEYTARKFFPALIKILPYVKIVSARNEYEKMHPGNFRQWKILTFLKTLNNFNTNLLTNIICVGDSLIEMEAAHVLASNFKKVYIKTVKFKQSPKLNELYKQINLLIDNFNKIFSSVKNMNIKVSKKEIECEA